MTRTTIILAAMAMSFASASPAVLAQADNGLTQNPTEVRAGSYVLDTDHGKITWSLNHMGFSTYVGQFTDVTATLDLDIENPSASRLVAEVKTDSVGSLNEALDEHLKSADFLDTANHPTARFQATAIHLTGKNSADITGNLTLRGVTRPIVMAVTFNQAGISPADQLYTIGFDGRARIKRSDYGISGFLPILGDEVTLHMEAEFKLAPQNGAGE